MRARAIARLGAFPLLLTVFAVNVWQGTSRELFNATFSGYKGNQTNNSSAASCSNTSVVSNLPLFSKISQDGILPPYAGNKFGLYTYIMIAPLYRLAFCAVPKTMSTVLYASFCFLNYPATFMSNNRSISHEFWNKRFCDYKDHKNDYEFIKYERGQEGARKMAIQFGKFLAGANVPDEFREMIYNEMLKGTTPHSTYMSPMRSEVEKQLCSDPNLMEHFLQIYFYDFVELGFLRLVVAVLVIVFVADVWPDAHRELFSSISFTYDPDKGNLTHVRTGDACSRSSILSNDDTFDENERCFGCKGNLSCFVEKIHRSLITFDKEQEPESAAERRAIYHFAPQTWFCDFENHRNDFEIIHYKPGPDGAEKMAVQLDEVLANAKVPIAYRRTIHQEVLSKCTTSL
ncbi:unnamed protein product [Nippostrongylus brasiliensis]|uniref:Uncharacterized protein n=1 Tax=Nippostrongylus brasiliensis TaxID=27835 RepID=A0A0N4XFR3_NIPBR|nr:unnamed protein product [Nippostrongylus brasiliensis]